MVRHPTNILKFHISLPLPNPHPPHYSPRLTNKQTKNSPRFFFFLNLPLHEYLDAAILPLFSCARRKLVDVHRRSPRTLPQVFYMILSFSLSDFNQTIIFKFSINPSFSNPFLPALLPAILNPLIELSLAQSEACMPPSKKNRQM